MLIILLIVVFFDGFNLTLVSVFDLLDELVPFFELGFKVADPLHHVFLRSAHGVLHLLHLLLPAKEFLDMGLP